MLLVLTSCSADRKTEILNRVLVNEPQLHLASLVFFLAAIKLKQHVFMTVHMNVLRGNQPEKIAKSLRMQFSAFSYRFMLF